MTLDEQINAFCDELNALVDRYTLECDMASTCIAGALLFQALSIYNQSLGQDDDADEDIEESDEPDDDESGDEWKKGIAS